MLIIAVAGLFISLMVIFFVILNFRSADAKSTQQPMASSIQTNQAALGTVNLLTPERKVSSGSALSEVVFKEVLWPRNQIPEGAIYDAAELRGMYAKMDLQPGVPIQRTQVTREPAYATLPLTPGNRAVAIPVDETAGIEGHALPGTRVDVILTYNEEGRLTSKVIVQNARVLSYGGDVTPISGRGAEARAIAGRRTSSTITLDVSAKDALALQTARQLGRLSLVMRAPDDVVSPSVVELNSTDIDGSKKDRAGRGVGSSGRGCSKGRIKSGGREYIVDCDGSIHQVLDQNEP